MSESYPKRIRKKLCIPVSGTDVVEFHSALRWPACWRRLAIFVALARRLLDEGLEARDGSERCLELGPALDELDSGHGKVQVLDETETCAGLAG